jgi:hypothetical protein
MHSSIVFYIFQRTTHTPCTTQITCMKGNYIRKTICRLWFSTIHINPHFCKGLPLTLGMVALISLTLLDKRSINYNLIHLTLGKVVLISLTLLEKRSVNYNLILMIIKFLKYY